MRMRAMLFIFLAAAAGCAGPSKARLHVLLSECREANRERARLLHEAKALCPRMPEQHHGVAGLGEGGY